MKKTTWFIFLSLIIISCIFSNNGKDDVVDESFDISSNIENEIVLDPKFNFEVIDFQVIKNENTKSGWIDYYVDFSVESNQAVSFYLIKENLKEDVLVEANTGDLYPANLSNLHVGGFLYPGLPISGLICSPSDLYNCIDYWPLRFIFSVPEKLTPENILVNNLDIKLRLPNIGTSKTINIDIGLETLPIKIQKDDFEIELNHAEHVIEEIKFSDSKRDLIRIHFVLSNIDITKDQESPFTLHLVDSNGLVWSRSLDGILSWNGTVGPGQEVKGELDFEAIAIPNYFPDYFILYILPNTDYYVDPSQEEYLRAIKIKIN